MLCSIYRYNSALTDMVFGDDAVVPKQQNIVQLQRAARAAQQQVLARVCTEQRHLTGGHILEPGLYQWSVSCLYGPLIASL